MLGRTATTSAGASVTLGVRRVVGRAVAPVLLLLLIPVSAQSFSASIICPRSVNVGDLPAIDLTLSNSGIDGQAIRVITTMVGQGVVETLEDIAVLGPVVAADIALPVATVLKQTVVVPTAVPESYRGMAFSQIVVTDGPEGNQVDQCLIAVPEPEQHWQMLVSLLTIGLLGQRARDRSNPRSQSLEAF
jgi:hypothetical protein